MEQLEITNAHLPDGSGPVTLTLANGTIRAITAMTAAAQSRRGMNTIDGKGGVILPAVVDGHIHLDKSLTLGEWTNIPSPSLTLGSRGQIGEAVVLRMVAPSLVERIETQARSIVEQGTLTARSHADVTAGTGLSAVEATLKVRQRLAGVLRLQVVAFPQFGVSAPAVRELLEEAMRLGCDVVGGIDPAGFDRDIEGQLRTIFGLAVRHRAPIDIHLHDPGHLGLFEIQRICDWTEAEGMAGRVAISHGLALGELAEVEVAATLDRLAACGVAVITNANLDVAMPRVRELDAHGVALGIGSDLAHSWAPFTTGDMFKKANLVAQRQVFVTDADLIRTWQRLSEDNAAIVGVPPLRVEVGAPADLIVASARNAAEAVASPPRERTVIAGGVVMTV